MGWGRIPARYLIALAALLLAAPPATAAAKAPKKPPVPKLKVVLPTAGQLSAEIFVFTYKGKSAKTAPNKFKLTAPGARKLPDSVRILYATRRVVTRKATTFAILVLAIRQAPRAGARAVAADEVPDGQFEPGIAPGTKIFSCTVCKGHFDREELVDWTEDKTLCQSCASIIASAARAPIAPGNFKLSDLLPLPQIITDWFGDDSADGGLEPLIGNPGADIDTGAYDDGHAFGWNAKGINNAEWTLVKALSDQHSLDDVIANIEVALSADLDGNAVIGKPAPAGGAPRYECVGPEVTIFDNWNTSGVDNGGAIPFFNTGTKAYCLSWIATYHFNGGKGKPLGTIGLAGEGTLAGPFKAISDGNPADWVAYPPAGAPPPIITGFYRCQDSDPRSWSSNGTSNGRAFCRVRGKEARLLP